MRRRKRWRIVRFACCSLVFSGLGRLGELSGRGGRCAESMDVTEPDGVNLVPRVSRERSRPVAKGIETIAARSVHREVLHPGALPPRCEGD
jgi:hypothetical protein